MLAGQVAWKNTGMIFCRKNVRGGDVCHVFILPVKREKCECQNRWYTGDMARILLPAHIQISACGGVNMLARNGELVLAQEPQYPAFFIGQNEVNDWLKSQGNKAIPSPGLMLPFALEGGNLVTDSEWGHFAAFWLDEGSASRVIHDMTKGRVDWKMQCPSIKHHGTMIGLAMRHQGLQCGSDPGQRAPAFMPPLEKLSDFKFLLREPRQELMDFRDRGMSLLDLACQHRQWRLAEALWQKGVRWTDQALGDGTIITSLITCSHELTDHISSARLDIDTKQGRDRVAWVRTWLDRYEDEGGPAHIDACIPWRMRTMVANGTRPDEDFLDTPASLWIALFCKVNPGAQGLPYPGSRDHADQICQAWAAFWARNGIDIEQTEVPLGMGKGGKSQCGFSQFWDNEAGRQWATQLRATWQHALLDDGTASARTNADRPRTRL